MKKILLFIATLFVGTGLVLQGCSPKPDIPKDSSMATYETKEAGQLKSVDMVPINHKGDTSKPNDIKVYMIKNDNVKDITMFGDVDVSNKNHEFATWNVNINQDKFQKLIKGHKVYYQVIYNNGMKKWYKVKM